MERGRPMLVVLAIVGGLLFVKPTYDFLSTKTQPIQTEKNQNSDRTQPTTPTKAGTALPTSKQPTPKGKPTPKRTIQPKQPLARMRPQPKQKARPKVRIVQLDKLPALPSAQPARTRRGIIRPIPRPPKVVKPTPRKIEPKLRVQPLRPKPRARQMPAPRVRKTKPKLPKQPARRPVPRALPRSVTPPTKRKKQPLALAPRVKPKARAVQQPLTPPRRRPTQPREKTPSISAKVLWQARIFTKLKKMPVLKRFNFAQYMAKPLGLVNQAGITFWKVDFEDGVIRVQVKFKWKKRMGMARGIVHVGWHFTYSQHIKAFVIDNTRTKMFLPSIINADEKKMFNIRMKQLHERWRKKFK